MSRSSLCTHTRDCSLSLSLTSLSLCDFFLMPQEIMFIETSAKEGFNIKLLFRRLATALPALESSGGDGAAAEPAAQTVSLTQAAPQQPAAEAASSGCGC